MAQEPARGADVLRFWVASVGFSSDVSISRGLCSPLRSCFHLILPSFHLEWCTILSNRPCFWVPRCRSPNSRGQGILKSTKENVRRLRNRARFILGNIADFDVAQEAVAYADLPVIDKCLIWRAEQVFEQMKEDGMESVDFE